jgi:hypothetical protein
MFQSIQYLNYLGYDQRTKLYSNLFKITDSDFEEEVADAGSAEPSGLGLGAGAVITCYSKRNLNVPKNLLLLFMFNEKQYGFEYYSIQNQIFYCEQYQPLFPKYKEEVEKYLLLI